MPRLLPLSCLAVLAMALCLAGCAGYAPLGKGPCVLPVDKRKVYLKKVINPTLDRDLSQELRSALRDEVNRRGLLTWVDKNEAQANLHIQISRFTTTAKVKDPDDATLKEQVTLILEAKLILRGELRPFWQSGAIIIEESFLPGDEDAAQARAVRLAVEEIADRMTQNY